MTQTENAAFGFIVACTLARTHHFGSKLHLQILMLELDPHAELCLFHHLPALAFDFRLQSTESTQPKE
jgi:hypothetical protein